MNEEVWDCASKDAEMNKAAAAKITQALKGMRLSYKLFESDASFDEYLDSCHSAGRCPVSRNLSCSCKDDVYRIYLVTYTRVVRRGRISEQMVCFVHDEADIASIEDECRMLAEDHIRDFTDVTRYDD